MRNILVFFLFLCLILALYSQFFLEGEAISFEETYKKALNLVMKIGKVFSNMKDGVVNTMQTVFELPERIGNFFTNFWHKIVEFFGGEIPCGCVEDCLDCKNAFDTITGPITDVHCGSEEQCTCKYCTAYRGGA